jgi:hypothetical protein
MGCRSASGKSPIIASIFSKRNRVEALKPRVRPFVKMLAYASKCALGTYVKRVGARAKLGEALNFAPLFWGKEK